MKYFAPTKLSENIRETPEGYLLCIGVPIARTGEMIYGPGETPLETGADGKVIVSRSPEELFDPAAMASFEGKSFTIRHPEEFVDPSNWKELTGGIVQNVRRGKEKDEDGEDVLLADILITDQLAIQLVKSGVREVSCGYGANYVSTGIGTGLQTDIRGNHVALVEQGRAGPSYAINDHKSDLKSERLNMSKFAEKLKAKFSKAVDEAMESEKKEQKDEAGKEDSSGEKKVSLDELAKQVKDLSDKLDAMNKPKDEEPSEENKASDEEVAPGLEDRLKALELAVEKIMEQLSEDPEAEESGDEDVVETGDTAARAEILAPGIKPSKDIKAKALKAAYGTKEGKSVIDSLTGGKGLTFDSAERVSHLFIAASEILKASRGVGLIQTKDTSFVGAEANHAGVMTAEKLNAMNAKFYGRN